jgi:NTE family protein
MSSSVPLNAYNFETLGLIRQDMDEWEEELIRYRCEHLSSMRSPGQKAPTQACTDVQTDLVEIDFERLKDEDEREYLSSLPTTFVLEVEQVDRLRAAAKRLMQESPEFQRLVTDLNKQ